MDIEEKLLGAKLLAIGPTSASCIFGMKQKGVS